MTSEKQKRAVTVYIVLVKDTHDNISIEKVFSTNEAAIYFAEDCPVNEEATVEAHEVYGDHNQQTMDMALASLNAVEVSSVSMLKRQQERIDHLESERDVLLDRLETLTLSKEAPETPVEPG